MAERFSEAELVRLADELTNLPADKGYGREV